MHVSMVNDQVVELIDSGFKAGVLSDRPHATDRNAEEDAVASVLTADALETRLDRDKVAAIRLALGNAKGDFSFVVHAVCLCGFGGICGRFKCEIHQQDKRQYITFKRACQMRVVVQ